MATAYPFDPTGRSTGNRIVKEQHVITAANFRDYHYVVPKFAPFFSSNMDIRLQYPDSTVRVLTRGVDYYFSHQFLDASKACAAPIYGSISFLDTDTAGILSIEYQTVGGMWTLSTGEITRILADELRNPRITTWEQITDRPVRFPVVDHEWDLIDMVGMTEVVGSIDGVREALLESSDSSNSSHSSNRENPHQVTKAQVGLGSVQNYTIASTLQAEAGIINNAYMSPVRTREAIAAQAGVMVNEHTIRIDNPHTVTKTQVGLGNVQNYGVATVVQATDGVLNNVYMTPLNTKAALSIVGNGLSNHIANNQNPHGVTKEQIGLFNVENYGIATAQEARDGSRPDRYMTPQRTKQLVVEYVSIISDGHGERVDNPHSVSKDQIGLSNVRNYAPATVSEAIAGVASNRYVTPDGVLASIQFNTYTQTQVDALLGGYLAIKGTAVNSILWDGMDHEIYRNWLRANLTNFNAATLNSLTAVEIIDTAMAGAGGPYLQTRLVVDNEDDSGAPDLWIPIGAIKRVTVSLGGSAADNPVDTLDSLLLVTGGNPHVAGVNQASNSFLVRTTCRTAPGLVVDYFYEGHSDSPNITFGHVWDSASEELLVYAKVANGSDNLTVLDLTGQFYDVMELGDTEISEPVGIIYATPRESVTSKLTALETTTRTIKGRTTALESGASALAARTVALETAVLNLTTLLNNITVV
jgi:hypothetical protein